MSAADSLRALGRDGLFRHAIPATRGGHGDGFVDLVDAHEALGLATRDPGLILAAGAHLFGIVFPLLRFGSDAQIERTLPFLLTGEWIGGHAITEPEAGSDTQSMTATATA